MSINQYELADLLVDEISYACIWYDEKTKSDWLKLIWGQDDDEVVILRHDNNQSFTIMISRTVQMWKDSTISVDEILDIVL